MLLFTPYSVRIVDLLSVVPSLFLGVLYSAFCISYVVVCLPSLLDVTPSVCVPNFSIAYSR